MPVHLAHSPSRMVVRLALALAVLGLPVLAQAAPGLPAGPLLLDAPTADHQLFATDITPAAQAITGSTSTAGATSGFDAAAVDPAVAHFGDLLQTGTASWYGHAWRGRRTASGIRFNPEALTAASATLPLGTRVLVTLEGTARSVLVTITDRSGAAHRIIDLSLAAARKIGMLGRGTATVTLRRA